MPPVIKSETTTIVSVDPGLQTAGVATFIYSPASCLAVRGITSFGAIVSDSVGLPLDERIRLIVADVQRRISQARASGNKVMFVIEQPPLTIYKMKIESVNRLIGRATDIMKLFALVYGLVTYCQQTGVYYQMIQPSQWQLSKKARGGLPTKEWSIKAAMAHIKLAAPACLQDPHLEDHNVCDAINIGYKALDLVDSKEWPLP